MITDFRCTHKHNVTSIKGQTVEVQCYECL